MQHFDEVGLKSDDKVILCKCCDVCELICNCSDCTTFLCNNTVSVSIRCMCSTFAFVLTSTVLML